MNEAALVQSYLLVGGLLFGIGVVGLVARRNLIVMFLAVEILLQGVSLSLVAFSRYHNDFGGQMLVIFIIAVAACEAAIALALFVALFQKSGTLDATFWQSLREENQRPYSDADVPDQPEPKPTWPELTPAGREPPRDPEKSRHRSHV